MISRSALRKYERERENTDNLLSESTDPHRGIVLHFINSWRTAVGLGVNRGFGGTNASDFGLATQIGGATVKADGKAVVENGALM